jgi:hypothetical protein
VFYSSASVLENDFSMVSYGDKRKLVSNSGESADIFVVVINSVINTCILEVD